MASDAFFIKDGFDLRVEINWRLVRAKNKKNNNGNNRSYHQQYLP